MCGAPVHLLLLLQFCTLAFSPSFSPTCRSSQAKRRDVNAQPPPYAVLSPRRATLPDKGFTAHVLGFTLHAVLEGVVGHLLSRKARAAAAALALAPAADAPDAADAEAPQDDDDVGEDGEEGGGKLQDLGGVRAAAAEDDSSGDEDEEEEERNKGAAAAAAGGPATAVVEGGLLDEALVLALPIIENEIFGHVAAAKEVAQFANNYKEAKKVRERRGWEGTARGPKGSTVWKGAGTRPWKQFRGVTPGRGTEGIWPGAGKRGGCVSVRSGPVCGGEHEEAIRGTLTRPRTTPQSQCPIAG